MRTADQPTRPPGLSHSVVRQSMEICCNFGSGIGQAIFAQGQLIVQGPLA